MRRRTAFAMLLATFSSVGAAQVPEALSVEQAVALALAQNRQVVAATLDAEQAEDAISVAKSRRLPVFGLNALASARFTEMSFQFPAGSFGNIPPIGPFPPSDTAVTTPPQPFYAVFGSVSQPLTQLHKINLGVTASTVERDLRRVRVDGARQAVATGVRRIYYAILQTEANLRAAEAAIPAGREVERLLRTRAAEQVVLDADAADAAVRLARAEQAQLALTHGVASLKEQLNELLGRDLRTPFSVVPLPPLPSDDGSLEAAIQTATERRPEVLEARLRLQQAEIDQRASSSAVPDVNLVMTYFSTFNADVLPQNLFAAGVQMNWEPWDWGRRSREAARKTSTIAQARLAVKDVEDRVAREVLDTWRKVEQARAGLRVAALTQDAARERLRVRTEQLKGDATLSSEVLLADAQLADATAKHQEAISGFWSARADLDRAVGGTR